jgi:hypothetical protein
MSYLLEPEVTSDLDQKGCPLCRASQRAGRTWIRELIVQQMTDSTVLNLVKKSGGLCPTHLLVGLDVAESEADTLGLALFADYMLRLTRSRLADGQRPANVRRRRGLRWWRRTSRDRRPCLACEAEERRSVAYIDILAELARRGDNRLKADWQLCFPHLAVAVDRLDDDAVRRNLIQAIDRRTDHLEEELATEIRKHSHDHRHLDPAPNGVLAAQTIRWLAGRGSRA